MKAEALLSFSLSQAIIEIQENSAGLLSNGVYRSVVNSLKNYVCDLSFWHEQPPNSFFHEVLSNIDVLST